MGAYRWFYPEQPLAAQQPMANFQQCGVLRLLSAQPDASQSCYSLSDTHDTAIGRTADCQIIIDSHQYGGVSRHHAVVRPTGTRTPQGFPIWKICDRNSSNGTYVNGQRLQGCRTLRAGDRIMLTYNGPEFRLEHQAQPNPVGKPTASAPPAYPVRPKPPPITRANQVTVSQIFPVMSAHPDLLSKGYLVPGILTVLMVVLLLIFNRSPGVFNLLLALYLGGGGFYFIYRLCGKRKPWWVLLFSALLTMVILTTPIFNLFVLIFREVLPGNVQGATPGFISQLISHFFGAGLLEELLKALPIFGFLWLGGQLRPPHRQEVGVWEPLDGILIGAASALGFTWLETLGQYVPGIAEEVARSSANQFAGELAAVQLLIPRVLGSIAGHMAYSGIFGYFIGLSILKPNQRWKIIGIGYLASAGIHAVWNAAATSIAGPFGEVAALLVLMIVGGLAYVFLTAAILKARQLSPTRSQNFATRLAPPD